MSERIWEKKIQNCIKMGVDREVWKRTAEHVKTHRVVAPRREEEEEEEGYGLTVLRLTSVKYLVQHLTQLVMSVMFKLLYSRFHGRICLCRKKE